jgi:hypothetical protein
MPLKAQSVEARIVSDLAALAVSKASIDGVIAVDVEARRLLDENPDCKTPFAELRDAIVMMAAKRGVGVEFGRR